MRMVLGLENTQLRDVFYKIAQALQQADLDIVDKGHVETMEVHVKNPEYNKYAFASIQCDAGKYVELRFPRRHLLAFGMIEGINKLGGDIWQSNSKDYIRFRFNKLAESESRFINDLSHYLKNNLTGNRNL